VTRALAGLAVLAVLTAGCGGSATKAGTTSARSPYRGLMLKPPLKTVDFALRDQAGSVVRLSSLRGDYVILTFLYTHCPDVCPLIANQLDAALRRLGPNVHVLAVSVDPRGDTPAAVRRFVRQHRLGQRFRYLTGTHRQLAPVWRAYHVAATPDGRAVDHSAFELLIDPGGRGLLIWDARVQAADVVHDLRELERSG
jgi:protein SCO1/2